MGNGAEIRLGEARVLGVDSEASGLLNVEVDLQPRPDQHWLLVKSPLRWGFSLSS
jgi:hypothetical protein